MQWLDFLQRSSKLLPPPTKREWELMNIPSEFSLYLKNVWREKTLRYRELPKAPLYQIWTSFDDPWLNQVSSEAVSEASKQTSESRARSMRSDAAVRSDVPKLGVLFEVRGGDELCTLQKNTRLSLLSLLVNHENPTQPPCTTSLTIGCFPRYQCSHRQLYALAGTGAFFAARWHAVFFHSAAALLQNCWLEGTCWVWDSLQKIHTQDWVPFKPI